MRKSLEKVRDKHWRIRLQEKISYHKHKTNKTKKASTSKKTECEIQAIFLIWSEKSNEY